MVGGDKSEIIFLGTGVSRGIPALSCLTMRNDPLCRACKLSVQPNNKNRRRTISCLIRYAHPDGRVRNIVIDVGKEFRQSALDYFPKYGIDRIDAVLLTHEHADAMGGMDDLRDWSDVQGPIPVYLRQQEMAAMRQRFDYLVDTQTIKGSGKVASLVYHIIDEDGQALPFQVEGVRVVPFVVPHGKAPGNVDYTALGFRFGSVSYISDADRIPADVLEGMRGSEVIVMDGLFYDKPFISHMSVLESRKVLANLRPRLSFLIGMSHQVEHEETNTKLARLAAGDGLEVQLAYDGLRVPVSLYPASNGN